MKTITLILPPEAMTDINPSDSSGVAAGVTAGMRIWVTVFIGEGQVRVSSSSEECSTLQKTVKVETYNLVF